MPLLSISIPTYNRAACLKRLLTILHEQAANDPRIEIIVSDNASTDNTREVVEDFLHRGMQFRYVCNPVNVGGDENIRRCYTLCGGKYIWVFGDDDVIAPRALSKLLALIEGSQYDLIFLAPYRFPGDSDDFLPKPRLWRDVCNVTSSPLRFADLVETHSDFFFISSIIINRQRAKDVVQPDLTSHVADNIVQLAWILPILKNLRTGVFLDTQWMGQATLNAIGGFSAVHFLGRRFRKALNCWLEPGSPLEKKLIDYHMTAGMFILSHWKWDNNKVSREKIDVANPHQHLQPIYGRNFRYWLCVYPLIVLPHGLAKVWVFPWLVRRKLLRLWYQTITPSMQPPGAKG